MYFIKLLYGQTFNNYVFGTYSVIFFIFIFKYKTNKKIFTTIVSVIHSMLDRMFVGKDYNRGFHSRHSERVC